MSSFTGSILVTDDDPELRRVLRRTLDALGFQAAESPNGFDAINQVAQRPYDAVLMDVNMPGIGGIEACRAIRRNAPRIQILMLTVKDRESDKLAAFDAGADDYITKPFSIPELAARLRAAVRRAGTPPPDTERPITIGAIELDPARRLATRRGLPLRLTPKEFDLLHYLMRHGGKPIEHSRLLRAVWGAEYGQELEYLRTFVHQLRTKLEDDPASPEYLLTERQFGYRFGREQSVSSHKQGLSAE